MNSELRCIRVRSRHEEAGMKYVRVAFAVSVASSLLASACLQSTVVNRSSQDAAPVDFSAFATPQRVGGDTSVQVQREPGAGVDGADVWRVERCRITTALPEGYPAPTPPGAIEIKLYPRARRAEVGGGIWPDMGMNVAFWPLFNHIKERKIAMTSPVEMDYSGVRDDGRLKSDDWTMSFLYREPEMGRLEEDGVVSVVDRAPLLVLSIGQRGNYGVEQANEGLKALREWLAVDGRFEVAGTPRSLYYNGPEQPTRDKWSEVQFPIKPRVSEPGD